MTHGCEVVAQRLCPGRREPRAAMHRCTRRGMRRPRRPMLRHPAGVTSSSNSAIVVGKNGNHVRSQRYWPPSPCELGNTLMTPFSPRTSPHPWPVGRARCRGCGPLASEHVVPAAWAVGAGRLVRRSCEVLAHHLGQPFGAVDVEHDGSVTAAVQHELVVGSGEPSRRSCSGRDWTCPASACRGSSRDSWCRGGRAARTSRRRRRPARRSACRRRRQIGNAQRDWGCHTWHQRHSFPLAVGWGGVKRPASTIGAGLFYAEAFSCSAIHASTSERRHAPES